MPHSEQPETDDGKSGGERADRQRLLGIDQKWNDRQQPADPEQSGAGRAEISGPLPVTCFEQEIRNFPVVLFSRPVK